MKTAKRSAKEKAGELVGDWFARTYAVGMTFVAAGIVGLLIVTKLDDGILTSALENIAAVTLGVGLISIPYEFFVHRQLSEEILATVAAEAKPILDAVQLDATLRASGLTGVRDEEVAWDEVFTGTKTICFIPDSPSDVWLNSSEWKAALEAAKHGPIEIKVYIPKPTGIGIQALAKRLDLDEAETSTRLEELQIKFKENWENAERTTPSLAVGSGLEVFHYEGFPSVGLVYCDSRAVIQMGSLVGAPNSGRRVIFEIGEGSNPFLKNWLETQKSLDGLGPIDRRVVEDSKVDN
jgi:hypothetical protein